jgi:hypothetical protein
LWRATTRGGLFFPFIFHLWRNNAEVDPSSSGGGGQDGFSGGHALRHYALRVGGSLLLAVPSFYLLHATIVRCGALQAMAALLSPHLLLGHPRYGMNLIQIICSSILLYFLLFLFEE